MLSGLKILIIGAGVGGLSASLALARRGAQVQVLEQAPVLTEVGAGLQISPNGSVVLHALGLGEKLADLSMQASAVQLLNFDGQPITRLDLQRFGGGTYHFVHRADLITMLHEAAVQAGVTMTFGTTVDTLLTSERATVQTSDGRRIEADLIVAADGINSVTRSVLNETKEPAFSGQVAWRALVPETTGPAEVRVFMGPRRHLVSYPLRGGRLRNIVAVQERAAWAKPSWSQKDDPANLRKAFADFGPEVTGLLSRVEHVFLWGLFQHPVADNWHKAHVALLGDAAHPTLPFLAQGANMALEDAWVLAASLQTAVTIPDALSAYQAKRKPRCTRIVAAARSNAWKYHLANPALRFAAHTALRLGGQIAPGAMVRQFDWLYRHDVTQ